MNADGTAPPAPRAPFACACLCPECGRLCATPPPPACPHCGSTGAIDLGLDAALDAVAELDAYARPTREPRRLRWAKRVGATVGIVAALAAALTAIGLVIEGILHGIGIDPFQLSGLLLLAYGVAHTGVVAAIHVHARTRAAPLPARWSMCAPDVDAATAGTAARAEAIGPLVRAPLSGRACLGYEVGLRSDRDGAAPLGTWTLLEQRFAPMQVGALSLDPGRTTLRWPRTVLDRAAVAPDVLRRFLRARGLSGDADDLVLFETILAPGTTVQARPLPHRTVTVVTPPEGSRLRRLHPRVPATIATVYQPPTYVPPHVP